jgi:hypothetical protein
MLRAYAFAWRNRMDDLTAALANVGFAGRVRLDSRIILARDSMSPLDIARIEEAGYFEVPDSSWAGRSWRGEGS